MSKKRNANGLPFNPITYYYFKNNLKFFFIRLEYEKT